MFTATIVAAALIVAPLYVAREVRALLADERARAARSVRARIAPYSMFDAEDRARIARLGQ